MYVMLNLQVSLVVHAFETFTIDGFFFKDSEENPASERLLIRISEIDTSTKTY